VPAKPVAKLHEASRHPLQAGGVIFCFGAPGSKKPDSAWVGGSLFFFALPVAGKHSRSSPKSADDRKKNLHKVELRPFWGVFGGGATGWAGDGTEEEGLAERAHFSD
jgi:hypothetical protein